MQSRVVLPMRFFSDRGLGTDVSTQHLRLKALVSLSGVLVWGSGWWLVRAVCACACALVYTNVLYSSTYTPVPGHAPTHTWSWTCTAYDHDSCSACFSFVRVCGVHATTQDR